ncbi:MAG: hypothetical protein AAGJ10_17540 [Bacteroidota bacterium]
MTSIQNNRLNAYAQQRTQQGSVEQAQRVENGKGAQPAANEASKAAPSDRVELSAAARASFEAQATEVGGPSTLSPERLAVLRDRVASGFYQQPEVLARTTAALAKDLLG